MRSEWLVRRGGGRGSGDCANGGREKEKVVYVEDSVTTIYTHSSAL